MDREVEQEVSMRLRRAGKEQKNTELLQSSKTNVQVSDAFLCGSSVLILTYVNAHPRCTHTSVSLARVPLIFLRM